MDLLAKHLGGNQGHSPLGDVETVAAIFFRVLANRHALRNAASTIETYGGSRNWSLRRSRASVRAIIGRRPPEPFMKNGGLWLLAGVPRGVTERPLSPRFQTSIGVRIFSTGYDYSRKFRQVRLSVRLAPESGRLDAGQ